MNITAIGDENYSSFAPFLEKEKNANHGYLGVIDDGQAIAAAEFSMTPPAMIVKNIFVDPVHRRKGAAKMLIEAAAETAATVGIYDILAYYGGEEGITAFFKSVGFTCFPTDAMYSISMGEVFSLKQYHSAKKKNLGRGVVTFDSLSPQQKSDLVATFTGKYDFSPELFEAGAYYPSLSLVLLSEDGMPAGVIMARTQKWDIYATAFATADGDQKTALKLLAAFITEIEKYFIPDSNLYFLGRNEKFVQSLVTVFGDNLKKVATGWSAVRSDGK